MTKRKDGKKNKIKFLNFQYDILEWTIIETFIEQGYSIVDNPTPYSNPPEGHYLIRGDSKYDYKQYYFVKNIWLLHPKSYISCDFRSFPSLPERDWNMMNKMRNRLSPLWQRYLDDRNQWMVHRNISRNVSRTSMKMRKAMRRSK